MEGTNTLMLEPFNRDFWKVVFTKFPRIMKDLEGFYTRSNPVVPWRAPEEDKNALNFWHPQLSEEFRIGVVTKYLDMRKIYVETSYSSNPDLQWFASFYEWSDEGTIRHKEYLYKQNNRVRAFGAILEKAFTYLEPQLEQKNIGNGPKLPDK